MKSENCDAKYNESVIQYLIRFIQRWRRLRVELTEV